MNTINTKIVILFATLIGLMYLIIVPPMQVPDEQSHFFRSYQISEGVLFASKLGELPNLRSKEHAGGDLPKAVFDFNEIFDVIRFQKHVKATKEMFIQSWQLKVNKDIRQDTSFSNSALFSFVMYSVPAAAIKISSVFSEHVIVQFYSARIAFLCFSILCLWIACHLFPQAKIVFLFVSILPMNMHQLASVSSDAYTYSVCLLFIAYVLKLCQQQSLMTKENMLSLIFLGGLVACSKQIAAPLLGLAIFIPFASFGGFKRYAMAMLLFNILMILILLFWAIKAKEVYVPLHWHPGTHAEIQIEHMKKYTKAHIDVFIEDLKLKSFYYLKMAIGLKLGYVDTILKDWVINLYLGTILLCIFSHPMIPRINRLQATGFIGIFLLGVIIIEVAIYVNTSPIGATYNHHVHGRYFLAYFPILLTALIVIFRLNLAAKIQAYLTKSILIACFIGSMASLNTLAHRYYDMTSIKQNIYNQFITSTPSNLPAVFLILLDDTTQ